MKLLLDYFSHEGIKFLKSLELKDQRLVHFAPIDSD